VGVNSQNKKPKETFNPLLSFPQGMQRGNAAPADRPSLRKENINIDLFVRQQLRLSCS
jgi:hypothetical protein